MRHVLYALKFLLGLSWRTDRSRLLRGGVLLLLGVLATPALAVLLRYLINAYVTGAEPLVLVLVFGVALALIAELSLGHFGHLAYFELGELNEQRLNRELLLVVNRGRDVERIQAPQVADRIDLLRQDIVKMRQTVEGALRLFALVLQTALTAVILGLLQPLLLLLVPVAVLPVVLRRRAEEVLEDGRERAANTMRIVHELRTLAADASAQPEVRLSGNGDFLVRRSEELYEESSRVLGRSQLHSAMLGVVGQVVFASSYVAAVILVFYLALQDQATIGDIVLVIALATQVSMQMGTGLELMSSVHAAGSGFRRLAVVKQEIGVDDSSGRAVTSGRLTDGIRLENVSYTYADQERPSLAGISLHLPAGSLIAIVGENGAGKSTLIKLLTGLYPPASGRVLVDGTDMRELDGASWRARTAVLFQDFTRFELAAQESIGVGELGEIDSRAAVTEAIGRASAGSLLTRLDGDLERLLGRGYGDGTDLSGGQWQSVAFSRTLMRRTPLLVCLDEPGHSLDPFTEQRVVEAYERNARQLADENGGVSVFVTHRLSTVRFADIIVVLERGRVAEVGSHAELLRANARYAELYRLQARAYT